MNNVSVERNLPEGWQWVQLKDITLPVTRVNREYQSPNISFDYIDIEAIDNKTFTVKSPKVLSWRNAPSRAQQLIKPNDILFAVVRPYLKNIAIVPMQYKDAIASTGFCVIRPIKVNYKYVYYYVLSQSFIDEVNELAEGTSYPAVSTAIIMHRKIALPPLEEQKSIVEKIEELFTALDQADETLGKSLSELKAYKYSMLKHAYEGKLSSKWRANNPELSAKELVSLLQVERDRQYAIELDEWEAEGNKGKKPPRFIPQQTIVNELTSLFALPSNWVWSSLGEVTYSMKNGIYKPNTFYHDTGVPCLRMYNIVDAKIVWQDIKRVELTPEELEEYALAGDDLLVNRVNSRELVGKAARIPDHLERSIFESKNIRIRLVAPEMSKFVNYWFLLCSNHFFSRNAQQTAGMASINQEQLSSFPLPLPSLEEQKQVVEEIETRFALIENLEETIFEERRKIQVFKNSILKKAFCGELTSQSETQETSSVSLLLQQINEEKIIYAAEQKLAKNTVPKTNKVIMADLTILEILESAKEPMLAREVWQTSKHKDDIEQFYAELKKIKHQIEDKKIGTDSFLSLKK